MAKERAQPIGALRANPLAGEQLAWLRPLNFQPKHVALLRSSLFELVLLSSALQDYSWDQKKGPQRRRKAISRADKTSWKYICL